MEYELNLLHLYPDLLNLYGDKGNIASLEKRLTWRGIRANITVCTAENNTPDFAHADIVFFGGGSDREEEEVVKLLSEKRDELRNYVENGGVLLATCGGFPMLGNYFYTASGKVDGLGVLDIATEAEKDRCIGDIILESELVPQPVCGFVNYAGNTQIGALKPFGKIIGGATGKSGCDGVIYKNVIATYLHGPLLPKNPMLCDYILTAALKQKYPDFTGLSPLDDSMETVANQYIIDRFITK